MFICHRTELVENSLGHIQLNSHQHGPYSKTNLIAVLCRCPGVKLMMAGFHLSASLSGS